MNAPRWSQVMAEWEHQQKAKQSKCDSNRYIRGQRPINVCHWMHWEPLRLLPIQILCKDNIRWLWMPVNAIECMRIREIASAPRLQASHALVLHTSDCTTLQSQASRGENISDRCVLWAIRYKWAYTIYFFVHIILVVQLAGASMSLEDSSKHHISIMIIIRRFSRYSIQ